MINIRSAVMLLLISSIWLVVGCSNPSDSANQSYGSSRSASSQVSYNKDGYNSEGYDKDGLDKNGYDKNGRSAEGYDGNGYDVYGFNVEGYSVDGYDEAGFDRDGRLKAGTYAAVVDYYDPVTKSTKSYNLEVEVENGEVTVIHFPNNGYLNDDRITPSVVNAQGYAKINGEEDRVYEVRIGL